MNEGVSAPVRHAVGDGRGGGVAQHPLRVALTNEVHARPYEQLSAPAQASYLALVSDDSAVATERAAIAALCERFGAHPPAPESTHFSTDLGVFRLKWERHTEFSAYTFIHEGPFEKPFAAPPIERVPGEWVGGLPGELMVAAHVAVRERDCPALDIRALSTWFSRNTVAGSVVAGGAARAWTDYQIHADGFGRILIQDHHLTTRQAGRVVQRLLEVETYRTIGLLALPVVKRHMPELGRLDGELAELTGSLTSVTGLAGEQELLARLSRLAARVEGIVAGTVFRFGASRAYFELVKSRIGELREERIEGLQTFDEFMERRLTPAMRTCEATAARLQQLSDRVARASDLLRTRVDVASEAQNQALLRSMDRRAHLQVRLQETVEGLSVVVLSYYLIGLIRYALKAMDESVLSMNIDLVTGFTIVPVVALVWFMMRRVRSAISRDSGSHSTGGREKQDT